MRARVRVCSRGEKQTEKSISACAALRGIPSGFISAETDTKSKQSVQKQQRKKKRSLFSNHRDDCAHGSEETVKSFSA